jgi:hypothetical protein
MPLLGAGVAILRTPQGARSMAVMTSLGGTRAALARVLGRPLSGCPKTRRAGLVRTGSFA